MTIACVLTALMAGAVCLPVRATSLSSITSDSIREKQDQIEQMEKDREKLESSLTDLQKVKKDLETQKSNLKVYVAQLDAQLAEIEQNIADLNQQITVKESEIETTQIELDAALQTEEAQQKAMINRIRMMYEQSNTQIFDIFLAADNWGDFLSRADTMEKVAAYDRRMYEAYKANRQFIELCKEQLELEKAILDQSKLNVETEQANLEDLIQQKNRDITNYETDINNKSQAIAEYEQMIKDQDAEIAAMEAAIAEEKKSILAANGNVLSYDGGAFKFPVASYTRVSDEYGMRIHPTLGVEQFHNGVDLASPKGTAIYAAYDGKVVAATYSATMGNYIMLDHGDELYTIYMHASALYVEKGDIVVRGETIAAVGSTGRSTGNHLHFSVRKNGAYVSPWEYISK
ncbi:MAG: peptidoglycan DD-metalloendopeptidase family protein [Clostridium sp.]|nr:peptidoglycan DD-metalloendopeptidase family protein [Acetatifactor muris]MCM1526769.1 peptidoglycan DD-metalloendopeptidase family protein [Bacteroides sp.]MCM1562771.1 peptidoglycan DD-metalloendopeptidase family protein [Clostridium sp.]